jgi:hypothetical protein
VWDGDAKKASEGFGESKSLRFMSFIITILLALIAAIMGVYFAVKRKYKYSVVVGIVALAIISAVLVWYEGYFHLYPFADTVKPKEFTIEKFELIRPGMVRNEAESLIGQPASTYIWSEQDGRIHCQRYTDDGAFRFWDFAWLNSYVCYDADNKVYSANKHWQHD